MPLQQRAPFAAVFLPLLVIALGVVVLLYEPPFLVKLRYTVFDQYQRWKPRSQVDVPVRIVDIDEESINRLGQWPWPRLRLAELTDRLCQAQAAVLGFDILFAESDRTSPANMAQTWRVSPSVAQLLRGLPDHDAAFQASLRNAPAVIGFATDYRSTEVSYPAWPFRFVTLGALPVSRIHDMGGAVMPLPAFSSVAKGLGAMSFVPDVDGVVRRVPIVSRIGETLIPSLVTEVLRVGQGQSNIVLQSYASEGLSSVRVGGVTIPTTPSGEMWLYYAEQSSERYVPAWKVLEGHVDPDFFRGHLVLLGSSAQGLMDLRFSPLGNMMSGVEAHAQALEQILSGVVLYRPATALAAEVLVVICAGLLIGGLALFCRALTSAMVTVVVLSCIGWGAWYGFTRYGVLLDAFVPGVIILAVSVTTSLLHHFMTEKRQRWIRGAFSRYISPNLVTHLVEHPESLELGGRRQVCSFVFSDLAGFTGFLEKNDPVDVAELLNGYLNGMISIAFRHQGTLDRIVGDAVAIMFSAPIEQPDHAERALRCALEMSAFSERYSAVLKERNINFGHTRIGVHTGEVIVGNFGGATVFDYRALGDAVNTTSRLEGANKYLKTRICVSAVTLALCPDVLARPIGRLLLKGKVTPLMVYEPVAFPAGGRPVDEAYGAAFALLAAGDPAARAAFDALAKERPDDPLVELHLTRLVSGERDDLIVLPNK